MASDTANCNPTHQIQPIFSIAARHSSGERLLWQQTHNISPNYRSLCNSRKGLQHSNTGYHLHQDNHTKPKHEKWHANHLMRTPVNIELRRIVIFNTALTHCLWRACCSGQVSSCSVTANANIWARHSPSGQKIPCFRLLLKSHEPSSPCTSRQPVWVPQTWTVQSICCNVLACYCMLMLMYAPTQP